MRKVQKTITVYNLAKLVLDYHGESTNPENVNKFAKKVVKTPEVYINFCQIRGLIK